MDKFIEAFLSADDTPNYSVIKEYEMKKKELLDSFVIADDAIETLLALECVTATHKQDFKRLKNLWEFKKEVNYGTS